MENTSIILVVIVQRRVPRQNRSRDLSLLREVNACRPCKVLLIVDFILHNRNRHTFDWAAVVIFLENANLLENYERDGPYRGEAFARENSVPAVLPLFLHHQLPQEAHEARPPHFHLKVPPVYLSKCPNSWAKIKMSIPEYSPHF